MCWLCENGKRDSELPYESVFRYSNNAKIDIAISGDNLCRDCLGLLIDRITESKCLHEDNLYPAVEQQRVAS